MTEPLKILVLDDQMLIAFEIATVLEESGFSIVGPFSNVTTALASLADAGPPDGAVLDINMGDGTTSEVLADALVEKGLPFIFLTGYGSSGVVPDRFDHVDKMAKPFHPEQLVSVMSKLTENHA